MLNYTLSFIFLGLAATVHGQHSSNTSPVQSGYSKVNGISMYYEIYGEGRPLVLIHGGGSTIQTSFAKIIPYLARKRKIIAMDLQAHGRTADRNTPLSFKQDADDVAALLKNLKIEKADILGFSNGGQTAIEFGIRHGDMANKLVICSAFYKRSAAPEQFWAGFNNATLGNMPADLQAGFLAVNNSKAALQNMFDRDVYRMKNFEGWTDDDMRKINAQSLVMNATQDVGTTEHAVEMYRIIPRGELVILPGGHGKYLENLVFTDGQWHHSYGAELIEEFLDKP